MRAGNDDHEQQSARQRGTPRNTTRTLQRWKHVGYFVSLFDHFEFDIVKRLYGYIMTTSFEYTCKGSLILIAGILKELEATKQQAGVHDIRLAEMDARFQCPETANYEGVLIWKVTDYTRQKQDAFQNRVSPVSFTVQYVMKDLL